MVGGLATRALVPKVVKSRLVSGSSDAGKRATVAHYGREYEFTALAFALECHPVMLQSYSHDFTTEVSSKERDCTTCRRECSCCCQQRTEMEIASHLFEQAEHYL